MCSLTYTQSTQTQTDPACRQTAPVNSIYYQWLLVSDLNLRLRTHTEGRPRVFMTPLTPAEMELLKNSKDVFCRGRFCQTQHARLPKSVGFILCLYLVKSTGRGPKKTLEVIGRNHLSDSKQTNQIFFLFFYCASQLCGWPLCTVVFNYKPVKTRWKESKNTCTQETLQCHSWLFF